MTSGRSLTNTKYVALALSRAITGEIAPIKANGKNAAPHVATLTIKIYNVLPSNNRQPTQTLADNLALNVSPAFRDTRYSRNRLAERAP